MVDVPEYQVLGTSGDPTGLEAALYISSLDVLLYWGSFDDDDEDRGHDR